MAWQTAFRFEKDMNDIMPKLFKSIICCLVWDPYEMQSEIQIYLHWIQAIFHQLYIPDTTNLEWKQHCGSCKSSVNNSEAKHFTYETVNSPIQVFCPSLKTYRSDETKLCPYWVAYILIQNTIPKVYRGATFTHKGATLDILLLLSASVHYINCPERHPCHISFQDMKGVL